MNASKSNRRKWNKQQAQYSKFLHYVIFPLYQ